jgi:AhpD family alkylhydroperoxidase
VPEQTHPALYDHLQGLIGQLGKQLPGPMAGFAKLHTQAVATGALTTRVKELMALAISIAVRCDGCIAYHVHDALAAGATHAEVLETIGVAVMMGGGPAVVYGAEAFEALGQFEAVERPANDSDRSRAATQTGAVR